MSTTGRNEPCPCGSGKKFKVCHGNVGRGKEPTGELLQQFLATADALEFQRQKQQGLGRPIISANVNGLRAVAVGDALVFTGAKTFHEFLWDYIKGVFGSEWGNCELKKPAAERHPMLNWYQEAGAYIAAARQQQPEPKGKVSRIESVGIVSGYLQLAYGLYLIAHNKELEQRLIKRLKHPDQFLPAYYEVLVFGTLVRAGFALEFENESDPSKTHCEVTATFLKTGKKFSVEAKMRQTATASVDIGRQLKKALLKSAASMRIVFAEVNLPELPPSNDRLESRILADIHKRERETLDDGSPLPSAYVVVTNHPFFYFPKQSVKPWALAEGFRLLDFGSRAKFATLREALDARRKHWEMFALMKSWEENYAIPMTFDGDIPELAFGEGHPPRLVIGHRYNIPDTNGNTVVGTLMDAVVMKSQKLCGGFYRTEDGKIVFSTCPLTDAELAAYERHPETFFGVVKRGQKPVRDGLELYDFFYEGHARSTKENLLKLLAGAPDFEKLKELHRDDLLDIYCERLTVGVFQHHISAADNPTAATPAKPQSDG